RVPWWSLYTPNQPVFIFFAASGKACASRSSNNHWWISRAAITFHSLRKMPNAILKSSEQQMILRIGVIIAVGGTCLLLRAAGARSDGYGYAGFLVHGLMCIFPVNGGVGVVLGRRDQ